MTGGIGSFRSLDLTVRRRLDGLLHGDHAGLRLGPGTEAEELTRYAPGHDVRRIDWNVTARAGAPQVWLTRAEHELDTWLLLSRIDLRADDEVLDAAKACYVDRFVHSLPDGYDTVINEEGDNISAGEKQLITIARAFLADRSILILDEATSSVDTRTEVLIQRAMAALRSNRTSFVIAHRLSTIRDADTILVMESGRIVEQGNHEELLAAGGAYHALYNAQFAGAAAEVA